MEYIDYAIFLNAQSLSKGNILHLQIEWMSFYEYRIST